VSLLGVLALAAAAVMAQTPQPGHTATFEVVLRGTRIGFETVTVRSTDSGVQISSTGRLGPPIDLTTTKFELNYTTDWQPQRLAIEGTTRGQVITLSGTFTTAAATLDVMQGSQKASGVKPVSARTVVLPNNFFGFYGAYEALAARAVTAPVGTIFPVYSAPESEGTAKVIAITSRRLSTPGGAVDLKQISMQFSSSLEPIAVDLWVDEQGHLARIALPAQALVVVRNDLSSVMTREERIRHENEEDVFVPSTGFNLAATLTKPSGGPAKAPAVVLVAGPTGLDRDEAVEGIPVFGQIAGALADAGYATLRYDKRGVGQSGGRIESTTLADYAADVNAIVTWLEKRKDIDRNRIALIGHAEGAAMVLLAAARDKGIRAVALIAASGTTGRQTILEQQQRELAHINAPDSERAAKVALQQRLIDAAITGQGWEKVPPDIRRSADVPWFKGWLLFDPSVTIMKVEQPLLIVHGSLDQVVPVENADKLEVIARGRKKAPEAFTRKIVVKGVNHVLVPAVTGNVEEYATLADRNVSKDVTAGIIQWLHDMMAAKK